MFFDAALIYDADTRTCDLELGEDGDLLIDETSITPVLWSIGLDRRAAPDDELPLGRSDFLTEAGFSERRGGPADALDRTGAIMGCKKWLLERAKKTETTRLFFQAYLEQCLEWAGEETGKVAEIETYWLPTQQGSGSPMGRLAYRIFVADKTLQLTQSFGGVA